MCTVTFIPTSQGTVITSNRDEQPGRSASAPTWRDYKGRRVVFPQEPKAGGTWFVLDEAENIAVLMNGGFEKHEWNPPYRMSRGIVLLDFFTADAPILRWETADLDGVEPFTIIFHSDGNLFRLVWDGQDRHRLEIDPREAHIWSSSPLYPPDQRDWRMSFFANFIAREPATPEAILEFHQQGGNNDREGFVIDRGFLRTVSITQAVIGQPEITVRHLDLVRAEVHQFQAR